MSLQLLGLDEIQGSLVALDHVKNVSNEEMVSILLNNGSRRKGLSLIHIQMCIRDSNMSAHFIRTDTDPNLSLLAYVLLADIEIQNVIDIIESVRYQIPQERVKALLIY